MAESCCQVIKALNNSILTFECIAKLSNDRPNDLESIRFEDTLEDGLEIFPSTDYTNFLEISYSTNCGGSYTELSLTNPDITTSYADNTLAVNVPTDSIPTSLNYDYTFIKIKFPVRITNIDLFECEIINIGEFSMHSIIEPLNQDDSRIGSIAEVELCQAIITEYDITVAGYSLNASSASCSSCLQTISPCTSPCIGSTSCTEKFTEDFTAAFLFNAINGDYGYFDDPNFVDTGEYIITIPSTNGVKFPTTNCDLEKVKISIASGCLCHGTTIDDINVTCSNGSLVITIPHTGTDNFDTCDMGGKFILVTIPYEIDDCTESPVSITGSIEFKGTTTAGTPSTTLASLDNFCLCVNTGDSQLMGVRKTILC